MDKINVKPLNLLVKITLIIAYIFSIFNFLTIVDNETVADDVSQLPVVTIQSRTGEDSIHRGQAFTIDIILSNNERGLTGLYLTLINDINNVDCYDRNVFELVNIKNNTGFSMKFETTNKDTDEGYNIVDPVMGGFNLMWDSDSPVKYNGVIATLTFTSNIRASLKDYNITFIYDQNNTRINYQEETAIVLNNSIVTLVTGNFWAYYENYDGTILQQQDCLETDIPEYTGEEPTRSEDDEYSYEFTGWENIVTNEKNKIVYRAIYKKIAKLYTITLYVDGEQTTVLNYEFGELINLDKPSKKDYTFFGWYTDYGCTKKLTNPFMPAYDLILYGRFNYNVREEDIPKIVLYHSKTENNVAYVDAYFIKNTGINGFVLTPKYDRTALTLIGYIDGTTEEGYILDNISHTQVINESDYSLENFKFFWESTENSYEIGKFLTLKFKVEDDLSPNDYLVTFTYEENKDATYIATDKSIWYTRLQIVDGGVPIGLRYSWTEFVNSEDDIDIKIDVEDGKPYNVKLVVEDITTEMKKSIDLDYLSSIIGDNKKISTIYSTKMFLNDEEFIPETSMKVKIRLTIEQRDYASLSLYSLDENNQMILRKSTISDGYIEFETDFHSDWAIICDKGSVDGNIGPKTFTLILSPSLLAVATMGTFLIYLGKRKKLLFGENEGI